MAVPKSKATRVGWGLLMQWSILCYTISPSFHFGSQNNVAGMLHCISSLQPTLVPLLFGTAIPTFPNNFCNCFYTIFVIVSIIVCITFSGDLSLQLPRTCIHRRDEVISFVRLSLSPQNGLILSSRCYCELSVVSLCRKSRTVQFVRHPNKGP